MSLKVRPIAIYLPQFHPIPENDTWWGKGFTEWTNVVKGAPRFKGHYQPHLPADLGFYDLRLPEVRQAQADLAATYGIYGFCYYHYWFNGRRILEKPFQSVIDSGKPDFPFMLCWANENWTRIWDGGENKVLLRQEYSHEDDVAHINSLIPYFKDPRYIRVEDKPVFAIYKDSLFPNVKETVNTFRAECKKHGFDLYLCKFERSMDSAVGNPESLGFDASIEFQPLSASWREYTNHNQTKVKYLDWKRYPSQFNKHILGRKVIKDKITDLKDFVEFDIKRQTPNYKLFPGVSPGFDNSCRRIGSQAMIFKNGSPEVFRNWVKSKIERFTPYGNGENFLFINAWNEWAEGNHLEPCVKYGHQYLEALKGALSEASSDDKKRG
ncbi:MAG: glycoside hydrolase family 99-like domain-containing protein [Chryseolinea sp.]